MSRATPRLPLVEQHYQKYTLDHDVDAFYERVAAAYSVGTLERLAERGGRMARRGAVLALSYLGDYRSNAVFGRALHDDDRGVRTLAEQGIEAIWCRWGGPRDQLRLLSIISLNSQKRFTKVVARANKLIARAPDFAEAYNQRAAAAFSLQRYSASLADCQECLELNPYQFNALARAGHCHRLLARPRAALECFQRALRLNPNLEGIRAQVVALERTLKRE